ncbi:Helicase C-terminal [Fusarium beomiforme]|uniref:Helicase C-terminal n=1 Tax=Fusarium beomiforme TaxID=44412 RepID=A0A9P5DTU4_9HYPO|nr:Helicase C-terminal [Fusarium beomiforme]
MRELSPYKRECAPHDLANESNRIKRACFGQPALLGASQTIEPNWLTPSLSSVPSHNNSASPFAISDSASPFPPSLDPQTAGNEVQEDTIIESSNDYELCCFGELLIDFISAAKLEQDNSHVPVELRFSGNAISLYVEGSGKYAGRLESKGITDLMQTYQVTLVTTLSCPSVNKKSTDAIQTSKTLHIVVYGFLKDMNGIGDSLEESDLFLQHPTEYDNRLEYLNPQYLLRPGSSIPRADDCIFQALPDRQSSDAVLEEKSKSQVHQVFDSASGPSFFFQVQQSLRLRTSLQEHQQKALAMMAEKDCGLIANTAFPSLWDRYTESDGDIKYEQAFPGLVVWTNTLVCGGVLADDMGLGKTLSTLALISWFLDLVENACLPESCRTTLIVAPNSTIPGWQEEIDQHIFQDQIRVILYHGSSRDQSAKSLTEYDIVLTTYGTLQSEWKLRNEESPLFSNTWARVVLDEAHHIRERSTQTFKAAAALRTSRRWCLTGTPIQNRLDDYGSLLSFIGVPPFTGKSTFDYWIGKPVTGGRPEGLARLRRLVSATCLRRTKDSVRQALSLPARIIRECSVQMDREDRELYEFFKRSASHLIAGMDAADSDNALANGNILSIINTLRLICNHGQSLLPDFAIQAWGKRSYQAVDSDLTVTKPGMCYSYLDEGHQALLDSVVCPRCANGSDSAMNNTAVGIEGNYQPSAKVRALMENLMVEQRSNSCVYSSKPIKSVVFTFWVKMLNLLEIALHKAGFRDDSCTVMIATIGSIGEGVDLTAANFVHFIEPHWNLMVEEQALDRVHRMGQTRDVVATRYITDDSMETRYAR